MDWNQRYQECDTPWDKGAAAPPLLEYLKNNKLCGRVLIPGCGAGHDVRAIAENGATAVGIDIAPLAIQRANSFSDPKNGEADYQLGDFFDEELQERLSGNFDYIFEHTCFCAISPSLRPDYASAAARLLKPGGQLLGIFFTDLESDSGPPFATPITSIEANFSPYFEIVRIWKPSSHYPGRENEESMILMQKKLEV